MIWIVTMARVICVSNVCNLTIFPLFESCLDNDDYHLLSLFVFLEKPLLEFCLIRIKELVGERVSTVGTHRNGNCLLKNTSNKHQLCCQSQLEHDDVVSFRIFLVGIRIFLCKIIFVYNKVFVSTCPLYLG